jgi:ethanolamine utilization cobalamin adenosyltransferase
MKLPWRRDEDRTPVEEIERRLETRARAVEFRAAVVHDKAKVLVSAADILEALNADALKLAARRR